MGQQNIWRLASGAAAAWSILEGCCLFHAWEAMVVIWTMIDDMRSWFGRAEFDPLWVLRRFWFVEEEDRLRLSQMKCYSGSVCSCKVYGSCREIYGTPTRNSWELGFWSRSRTACIVVWWRTRARSPVGKRCRLMCLVYIRCLFCEASGTSSIGCFVCDLHRFSIKLNGSVKHWKTWYAYFKYTTRMGYVPPLRKLRYRTNLFVLWGWYKELMTYCCVIMYLEV